MSPCMCVCSSVSNFMYACVPGTGSAPLAYITQINTRQILHNLYKISHLWVGTLVHFLCLEKDMKGEEFWWPLQVVLLCKCV